MTRLVEIERVDVDRFAERIKCGARREHVDP
jgi:hypothetical protein